VHACDIIAKELAHVRCVARMGETPRLDLNGPYPEGYDPDSIIIIG
jgi:hypothetical protein